LPEHLHKLNETYYIGQAYDYATHSQYWTKAKIEFFDSYLKPDKKIYTLTNFKIFKNNWPNSEKLDLTFLHVRNFFYRDFEIL